MNCMPVTLEKGMKVILNVPENPRLNGANGIVKQPTEWGAYIALNAAATGEFRALHEELIIESEIIESNGVHIETTVDVVIPTQYTGDICIHCQSARMRRVGTCLRCDNCGDTTGC